MAEGGGGGGGGVQNHLTSVSSGWLGLGPYTTVLV